MKKLRHLEMFKFQFSKNEMFFFIDSKYFWNEYGSSDM